MYFCVCTVCTLNCKDCTEWIPYLKNKKIFSAKELILQVEKLFKTVDYIHIISPIGGEPFANKDLAPFLDYLQTKVDEGKIGHVRLVTNGTIYPGDETLSKFKHPNFYILISDYKNTLNEAQKQNLQKIKNYLTENKCLFYYNEDFQWIDLGVPELRERTKKETDNTALTCFVQNCSLFAENKLYKCPRAYILHANNCLIPADFEIIDFEKIKTKRELKKAIKKFYSQKSIKACKWCHLPKNRKTIPPAIQL